MTLRPISIEGFQPVKPPEVRGSAVSMKWIPIEKLRIDSRYQRVISSGGKSNTRQIAARFSWRKFTPVVVCKIDDTDLYAIIDGQHRTTAAALIGLLEVPCAIVSAPTVEEQADSFKSINANITRVTTQDLHFANLASGDPEAKAIDDICKKTGITIIKNPKPGNKLLVGECQTVHIFKQCLRDFGEPILVKALDCIVKTGNGNPGLLCPALIKAICKLLKANPKWAEHRLLITSFENINVKYEFNKAMNTVTDYRTSKEVLMMQAFHPKLTHVMGPGQ